MGQLSKGLAHNDPVTGQPVGWYDSEVYGKIMSMTDDYIAAQHDTKGVSTIDAQKLHAYVDELTNKTMDAAISDYLNGQYVSPIKFLGISFGEKLDNDKISSALAAFSSKDTYTTGQGKSVMGVLKADLGGDPRQEGDYRRPQCREFQRDYLSCAYSKGWDIRVLYRKGSCRNQEEY